MKFYTRGIRGKRVSQLAKYQKPFFMIGGDH